MSDWSKLERSADEEGFDPRTVALAKLVSLEAIMDRLASPDDGSALSLNGDALVSATGRRYPLIDGRPVLLPQAALRRLDAGQIKVPLEACSDAFDQYLYLAQVKNMGGDPNSPLADPWYRRHLYRSQQMLKKAAGLVLDIGCDDPELSRKLFPAEAEYLGLEPAIGRNPGMRLVGMAEFLPLRDACVDGAAFLTSLDHVMDYHAAIDEAFRVLKPGGALFVGALVWTHEAGLHRDNIHFHHFRDFELQGALRAFEIEEVTAYGWKGDGHRFAVYARARKPTELSSG